MIQRFVTSLRALAALPMPGLTDETGRRLRADCADAVRLELDCPQQEFTRAQRARLRVLSEVLDDESVPPLDVVHAVRETCATLGIALAEDRVRGT
jgi:hypothetical protein